MITGTFFDLIPIYRVLVLTGEPNNTQLSVVARLVVIAVGYRATSLGMTLEIELARSRNRS